MIVTTKTLSGKTRHYDQNGRAVNCIRARGRATSKLPDYAFRYLTPGVKKAPELTGTDQPESRLVRREKIQEQMREEFRKAGKRAGETKKLSARERIYNWFKRLFAWATKKK